MSQNEVQMPRDYTSWKNMITGQCGESLSEAFITSRLQALRNKNDPFGKKFRQVYGEDYTKTVISWFERARNDIV